MRFSKARFYLFFALLLVLGLFFFFFFFNASSYSFSFPDPTSRSLISGITEASDISWAPEGGSLALGASANDRPRQSSHSHRRYLPSGINQLNARLLEASLSLKPILLAFLCFPILFPPARRVRGEAAIRPIYRLLIQLVFLPSVYTGHPWILFAIFFDDFARASRSSYDCNSAAPCNFRAR